MPLATQILNLAVRSATEAKALRTLINGNAADLSALQTTGKANLVAALNELKAALDGIDSGAAINDGATNLTQTWSSQKISDQIATALAALTTGAPAALDTLDELAAALGDDANFAATVTAALGNRVRVDAAQGLTAPQQAQARANIGAVASADIGNTETDFVASFNAALV